MIKRGWLTVVMCAALGLATGMARGQTEADRAGWQSLAEVGEGYVVWESNRSGAWRIWYRELDGSNLRQLTRDDDREHYAAHIAPDGKHIAYVSFPRGKHGYNDRGGDVRLHIHNMDTSQSRTVVDRVHIADGGHRSGVWVDNQTLHFLDRDKKARSINIATNAISDVLIENKDGLLLNPTGTCAYERFFFHEVDPNRNRIVSSSKKLGGCEPYFTMDGRWGIRMSGAGGPISRVDLNNWKLETILDKNDKRMPDGRGYLYFPMVSPCQRLLTFSASKNQHDHHKSDYDVFIAPIDPRTLLLTADPVRYTFDDAVDRYPSVYMNEMDLGRFAGEVPLKVKFTSDELRGRWSWDFGDGGSTEGGAPTHTFTKPGTYEIKATQGDRTLRGLVTVRPAAAPKVTRAMLRDERTIVVSFDEPIEIGNARANFAGDRKATRHAPESDHTLVITVDQPITDETTFALTGVRDAAQTPNTMQPTELTVAPVTWPVDIASVVYALPTADDAAIARKPGSDEALAAGLQTRGTARLDGHHAMLTDGGAYIVEGVNDALLEACRTTNELTVEALIQSHQADQRGPARIVSFSNDSQRRNFTLGQERDQLIFRLRTTRNGENGMNRQPQLGKLPTDRLTHVVVTYSPGNMTAYIDGKKVLETDEVQGDFSNWSDQQLMIGDEYRDDRDWHGRVEHVAIYNKALTADQVAQSYAKVTETIEARPTLTEWTVKGKLVAVSEIPTLEQINPYREALVVAEYERADGKVGEDGKPIRFRVAHWAILDAKPQSITNAKPGQQHDLTLQMFEQNPQLESLFISDTLELNLDLPMLYAPQP